MQDDGTETPDWRQSINPNNLTQFWLYYWAIADGLDLLSEAVSLEGCAANGEETYVLLVATFKDFYSYV